MKFLKKFILWTLLILCSILIISFSSIMFAEKENLSRDAFISNLAVLMMFIPIEIGLLLELNFLGLKNKFPFLNSSKFQNHILIWVIILFVSFGSVICCYSNISEEYKSELTSESVVSETNTTRHSTTTVAETTTQLIPKTTAATTAVLLPDKSENVSDETPLVFYYDDAKYTVGNCSFAIEEINVATQGKSKNNATNIYRIYGKVKNNSSETTVFTTTKYNSFIVGSLFEDDKEEYIGFNDVISWKSDEDKPNFSRYYTLSPGEEKSFAVQALYVGSPKTYDYSLEDVVFYFCNNDNLIEISFK